MVVLVEAVYEEPARVLLVMNALIDLVFQCLLPLDKIDYFLLDLFAEF